MATVVQVAHGGVTFGGTSGTAVFGSNVTAGNAIVVAWCFRDSANTAIGSYTISVTDSQSTSYGAAKFSDQLWNAGNSRNFVNLIHAGTIPTSGANTVTCSVSAGMTSCKGGGIFVYEVAGLTSLTGEGHNIGDGNTATYNGAATGNVTWNSTLPFLVSIINSNDGSLGTITSDSNIYSVQTDGSQNFTFGSLYQTGTVTSPATFAFHDSVSGSSSGVTILGAAFPSAATVTQVGWENQGPVPQRMPFHRLAQLDERWSTTLVIQPPWGWDNQGPPPKPLPFHRLEQHFERWPNTAVGGLPNHFAWWYDLHPPPQRRWRPPPQQIEIFYPIIPPPNLVTQLGWENQGPPPQRLPFHRLPQGDERWPFLVVATPTQFGWEIQANPPIRVPFHRLPQLSETWPFATVAITPTQMGWEIQGSPPIRIPFHRLPQVDGYPPGGQTPGPPFLAYGYLRALKVG